MAKPRPPQDVTLPTAPAAPPKISSMADSETLASESGPPAVPPTLPVTLPTGPAPAGAPPALDPTLATGPAPAAAPPNLPETLPVGTPQGKGWHVDSATVAPS